MPVSSVLFLFYLNLKGDIGPFEPSVPTQVPLWLAIHFRQRQKCRIECPSWVTVGNYSFHSLIDKFE
jgi:hypothetical protein